MYVSFSLSFGQQKCTKNPSKKMYKEDRHKNAPTKFHLEFLFFKENSIWNFITYSILGEIHISATVNFTTLYQNLVIGNTTQVRRATRQ